MSDPPRNSPPSNGRNGRKGMVNAVATDVVDVFRASPGLLLIIILNVIFLGGLGYILLQLGDRRADEFKLIISTMNEHYNDVMRLCTSTKMP